VVDRAVPLPCVAIDLPSGLRITGLDAAGAATVISLLREAP
jgi:NAD(P)H-hydrate repair Nnr-like enzyme with NAD(P)H-hydrate epimerase domain